MKPEYLRLNEVAELLECEPHHVKDLVAQGRLRCGVMAQAWWGHAFPLSPDGPSSWHGGVIDINRHNDKDKTYIYDDEITGASFRVRTGYVAQFWYLHHGSVYPLCTAACEQIEDFLLAPAPGVGEQLHQEDPERWPWPEFLFWPNRDQDPPVRATWQDILFLRGDVEALSRDREVMGNAERARLLKTIGAMALVLGRNAGKYKAGDRPNAAAIADAVTEMLDAMPDANAHGLGKSSVRAAIADGLKLLKK